MSRAPHDSPPPPEPPAATSSDAPPAATAQPEALGPRVPESPKALFVAFAKLALQGFGGVLPLTQHALVEREQWLTKQRYVEVLTIAQVMPGPNVVNLAMMVGDRFFGWRGAVAALAGMIGPPLVLVLLLAMLYAQLAQHPVAAGAMRGMGAVASGLVLGTALKLLPALKGHAHGAVLCGAIVAVTALAVALLRWPLAAVVLGVGGTSVALAWWRMQRQARTPGPRP